MDESTESPLHLWCDQLVHALRPESRFCHKYEISADTHVHEIHHGVRLTPTTSLWRVAVIGAIRCDSSDELTRVQEGFVEHYYEPNLSAQILVTDGTVNPGLRSFLEDRQIVCVEIGDVSGSPPFSLTNDDLFPSLSDEEIRSLLDHQSDGLDTSDPPSVREALLESVTALDRAIPLFRLLGQPPTPDTIISRNTSLAIEELFYTVTESSTEGVRVFVYPNRFAAKQQIHASLLARQALIHMQAEGPSARAVAAAATLHESIIRVSLALLYGETILSTLEVLQDSMVQLAQGDCLAFMAEGFEDEPFDRQALIIHALTMLDLRSEITKRVLLQGARSRIAVVAQQCIAALTRGGFRDAVAVLEELAGDRRAAVREAAAVGLQQIQPRDDPFEAIDALQVAGIPPECEAPIDSSATSLDEDFARASKHALFMGPRDTHIHIMPMGGEAVAITRHPDGSQDMNLGKRVGLYSYVAKRLVGAITPDPAYEVAMGEAKIFEPDGRITTFRLDGSDASPSDSGEGDE